MQRIFLTGRNGFIGRHLIEQGQISYNIVAPTRTELNLTDRHKVHSFLADKEFDCMIHTAAIGVVNTPPLKPFTCLKENLLSFTNIFSMRHRAKRLIHLGSGAEYGRPLSVRQIDETQLGQLLPQDEYGLSKLLATTMLSMELPEKAVSLHLFGVFGPYEETQVRFISHAITRSLLQLPITINQNVEFDYLYIYDLIKIIDEFINRPAHFSSYNITTGRPITLLEIAEIIRDITGLKQDIIVHKKGMGPSYTGSNERLKTFLGPRFEFTPIKYAIESLILWYEKNRVSR